MLGLSVVLYPDTRQYGSVVMNGYKGFKALIHNAQDFPEVGGKGFAIGSGKEVFVGIGAQYITATEISSTLNCCKEKGVPRGCQGLCMLKTGRGRSGVAVGSCNKHYNNILHCLKNGKYVTFKHKRKF